MARTKRVGISNCLAREEVTIWAVPHSIVGSDNGHSVALCSHTTCGISADFRGAKSTHIPHRQLHSFSRNADALCEVIVHPIDPRATPLLRGRHPRHSLQEPSRTARQARAMAFRNAEGQRGKYLTLELSSTRNPVEDMYAVVSKFQSAKIGDKHS